MNVIHEKDKYAEKKKALADNIKRKEDLESRMEELDITEDEKKRLRADLIKAESELKMAKRRKMKISDFESLALIGRGAFGEVRSCIHCDFIIRVLIDVLCVGPTGQINFNW